MPLPKVAILQMEGETKTRMVKIVPHGPLADADLPPTLPSAADLVLPIEPSIHQWIGDEIQLGPIKQ